ncbi:MAG: carbonic anhydrase [Chloroflexi bacterium]|nr:carbonic anhydrase [Chloroflexota bacterium]
MAASQHHVPDALAAGYQRFREGRYADERQRYRELGSGAQRPATMVVACSDSRSAPETIFDAGPGELFVVRNVAALVPPYAPDSAAHAASAALEYGVLALGVSSIVVLGHGRCGGIAAAHAEEAPLSATDFIGTWVAGIRDLVPAARAVTGDDRAALQLALERASVERSLANLRTFPWIRSREADGRLGISGAWFDIALGELQAHGPDGWRRVAAG